MKEVVAEIQGITRRRSIGIGNVRTYDDHVICLTLKIYQGPDAWLDRRVHSDIKISELISVLPEAVKTNLRDALAISLLKDEFTKDVNNS